MKIERLTSSRTAHGPLFCPRCSWKLGRVESPAIGYLARCGGCKRGLKIRDVEGGGLAVIVMDDRSYDDVEFVDLEARGE